MLLMASTAVNAAGCGRRGCRQQAGYAALSTTHGILSRACNVVIMKCLMGKIAPIDVFDITSALVLDGFDHPDVITLSKIGAEGHHLHNMRRQSIITTLMHSRKGYWVVP